MKRIFHEILELHFISLFDHCCTQPPVVYVCSLYLPVVYLILLFERHVNLCLLKQNSCPLPSLIQNDLREGRQDIWKRVRIMIFRGFWGEEEER